MVETMNQCRENLGSSLLLIDSHRHNLILGTGGVGGKRSVYGYMHQIDC